jgi:hypothetical protein
MNPTRIILQAIDFEKYADYSLMPDIDFATMLQEEFLGEFERVQMNFSDITRSIFSDLFTTIFLNADWGTITTAILTVNELWRKIKELGFEEEIEIQIIDTNIVIVMNNGFEEEKYWLTMLHPKVLKLKHICLEDFFKEIKDTQL